MTKKLLLVPLVMANKKKYNVRKGFKWPKRYDTHEMTAMQCDDDDFGTSVWPAKWEKGSITWTCHVRATCLFSVFFFYTYTSTAISSKASLHPWVTNRTWCMWQHFWSSGSDQHKMAEFPQKTKTKGFEGSLFKLHWLQPQSFHFLHWWMTAPCIIK